MIPPAGMAIAAMTVMLWILWSDSVRPRKTAPILYALRIALYLIVGAVLLSGAAVAALLGKKQIEQATPPAPEQAIESVKRDVETVKAGARG